MSCNIGGDREMKECILPYVDVVDEAVRAPGPGRDLGAVEAVQGECGARWLGQVRSVMYVPRLALATFHTTVRRLHL